MRKKKYAARVMAAVLAGVMVLPGCGGQSSGETDAAGTAAEGVKEPGGETQDQGETGTSEQAENSAEETVEKPEKITFMVDGTLVSKANGQDEWVKRWEELTGIELEIIQPDHTAYYDVLGQTIASGPENWPDVLITTSQYYTNYAKEGVLWDMTQAWENSSVKKSGRIVNENVVDSLYIDDHLYGLATGPGMGCITYIKKQWLDNVGLDVPTNYEEYLEVLDAFTNGDPDRNGVDGDTFGVSAAGFINAEAPYIQYLPEFWQDAYPTFYQKEDGTWVDGFTEDSMKEAIVRLKEAYDAGYIEKETLTNATSDCRNKFLEDKFGVFTYWPGSWQKRLTEGLEANGHDGELIPIAPIAEVGAYIDRTPVALCITSACDNPEGVFKYFLETALDGGEVQELWTYGVEGVHWSTAAEEVCGVQYEEGQFHMLESREAPGTQYTKAFFAGDNPLARFEEGKDKGAGSFDPMILESNELFNANSRPAQLPVSTDEMAQYNGDLTTLKYSIIADCITQGISVEEGMKRFEEEGGAEWSKLILDSLNQQ
ncbi:MAG TPA: extracellular solute-binding protein [Candidatus Cottocaccamicrobium excrementipullorum]|nr:extracellular solute-binding protein [Candidatus Cottocaccamicrobium excrementipullorum]